MKKKILIGSIIISFFCFFSFCVTTKINYTNKIYYSSNNGVTNRELMLMSALSYIDVPTKCTNILGKIKTECNYKSYPQLIRMFNESLNLYQNATVDELDGWKFSNYEVVGTGILPSKTNRTFYAYTLEKGDNVVIVYRGTDFIDAFEWLQDVVGGVTNVNPQESFAEKYALETALKYSDKNIYITGHSLGGYLAQIGASALHKAIKNGKTNSTDWTGFNYQNSYKVNDYLSNGSFINFKNIKLEQVVYFDGIGMNVFSSSTLGNSSSKQDNKIIELKELRNEINNFNNETKLIAYCTRGDIVSQLGIHYAEVREITPSIDTIRNYKRLFSTLGINITDTANKVSSILKFEEYVFNYANELNLIKTNVLDTYKEYNLGSTIGSVVMTHKIDSLICSLNNNGNDVSVKVVSENLYHSIPYLGDLISKEQSTIYTNSNINLIANTFNACARKYEWYSCNSNGGQCQLIYSSTNSNQYKIDFNNEIKYIKVRTYFDDSYSQKELVQTNENNTIYYSYKNVESNPKHSGYKESNLIKVVHDNVAPVCYINNSSIEVVRTCNNSFTLKCNDDLSGISSIYASGNAKDIVSYNINNYGNNSYNVVLTGKSISLLGRNLNFNSIKDNAGNYIKNAPSIKVYVKTKLFNSKKCN